VELFLNIVWLATSLLLVAGWLWTILEGHVHFEWTTLIALAVLIVILFPAISMTDDLVAMSAPGEVEHMMRRSEAPLAPVVMLGLLGALPAIAMVVLRVTTLPFCFRIRNWVLTTMLLDGFIRAFGVRPPPPAGLFAR
jgi:hypothetical protein